MRSASSRLDKLEQRLPTPAPQAVEREAVDFGAMIARIEAESARVEALPPAQKIAHIRLKIAESIAKAEAPPQPDRPGGVSGLAANMHELIVKLVKDGFHSEHYEIRRCEIEILRQHHYDVRQVYAAHHEFAHLPWQWIPDKNSLPPDAKAIIDQALNQEAAP